MNGSLEWNAMKPKTQLVFVVVVVFVLVLEVVSLVLVSEEVLELVAEDVLVVRLVVVA